MASILVCVMGPAPNAALGHVSARHRLKTNRDWGHVRASTCLIRPQGLQAPGYLWHLLCILSPCPGKLYQATGRAGMVVTAWQLRAGLGDRAGTGWSA